MGDSHRRLVEGRLEAAVGRGDLGRLLGEPPPDRRENEERDRASDVRPRPKRKALLMGLRGFGGRFGPTSGANPMGYSHEL